MNSLQIPETEWILSTLWNIYLFLHLQGGNTHMVHPYVSADQPLLSGLSGAFWVRQLPHQYLLLSSLIVFITNTYIVTCSECWKACIRIFKERIFKFRKTCLFFSVQFVTQSGCRGSGTPGGIVTHPWGESGLRPSWFMPAIRVVYVVFLHILVVHCNTLLGLWSSWFIPAVLYCVVFLHFLVVHCNTSLGLWLSWFIRAVLYCVVW